MAKSLQSAPEVPTARLSGFAPAIAKLYGLDLPAKRIAELFGTNSGYVHVLVHRHRKASDKAEKSERSAPASAVTSLSDADLIKAKAELKVRAEIEGVELTPKRLRNLEWLQSQMEDIASTGRNTYRYLQAVSSLKALKPYIGFPSDSGLLKIAAKLHQHLAWFYTHSGLASSCIAEATQSIRLYEIVYHDTEDKDALRELGGSCLIRSNSRLSDGSGQAALSTLKLSEQATLAADIALNSEYFQQRGVALLQTRQDEAARRMFERARATTPDSDVRDGPMTLKMSSDRYLNLIAAPFPRLDDELELLDQAQRVYGPDSLEAVVCAQWAAAGGLCIDSKTAHLTALDLIEQNRSRVLRFGHEATIAKLLPLALELPARQRPLWVRFALYQNAYRSK